ncbi:MAG: hypothetical protein PUP90_06395 [Nostoc sp. S4]|nr:hypothetical protein [Nostoc sp. S4]
MFKPRFTRCITIKLLVFSTAFFLVWETSAKAQRTFPNLTPAQAQHLSRDLVPSSSEEFFRQGKNSFEREIQLLRKRQLSPNKPILKNNLTEVLKKPSTQE